jgi:hypothetical protein
MAKFFEDVDETLNLEEFFYKRNKSDRSTVRQKLIDAAFSGKAIFIVMSEESEERLIQLVSNEASLEIDNITEIQFGKYPRPVPEYHIRVKDRGIDTLDTLLAIESSPGGVIFRSFGRSSHRRVRE